MVYVLFNLNFLYYQLEAITAGGDLMEVAKIGKNIRKYRLLRKMRQEDLAAKTGLSSNYIGMVERGEKQLSLESFVSILNALDASADIVLADVLNTGYEVKESLLSSKLEKLSSSEKERVYNVIEAMIAPDNK